MGIEEKINLSQINDISEGDMEFEDEIITMYIIDTQERISNLENLLTQKNWKELKREAHTLKGSSGNIGVIGIFELCKKLEAASLNQDEQLARELVNEIRTTTVEVDVFLKNYLKTN